jgi:hypothetical protein
MNSLDELFINTEGGASYHTEDDDEAVDEMDG